jgi:hypothetical protein
MTAVDAAATTRREADAPAAAAVLLAWFSGAKQAARNRRAVESRLRSDGSHVLETTVLQIDRSGKASVHDPRRVLTGALTAALTWGVFGLLSGGWPSLLASAPLGAAWGAWVARSMAHHLTEAQLARAGARLPHDSSALLVFTDAANGESVLAAAGEATVASVASVAADLGATILPADGVAAGASDSAEQINMVVARYNDPATAKHVAAHIAANKNAQGSLDVELVIETDRTGRRHVSDPKLGAAAAARYNVRSWTVLGLICGALAGLTGGHGFAGFLEDGLVTAIAWGLFGAAAGVLYGLWVGRSTSARRLRPIASLLPENTSSLVAWTDAPPDETTLAALAEDGKPQRLILSFVSTERGAVLAVD